MSLPTIPENATHESLRVAFNSAMSTIETDQQTQDTAITNNKNSVNSKISEIEQAIGDLADTAKYVHPSYTAKSSGLYKITVDTTGHVNATTVVTKVDITNLGIPSQDTVYIHPTTSGNKHIPSGGSAGQILRWGADGTAIWGNDNNTIYTAASAVPKVAGTAAVGSSDKYAREDHVHPPQTSVSGNAGTATKLQNGRIIRTALDSESAPSFDGSANITPGVSGILPISHGGTGNTSGTAKYVSVNDISKNENLNNLATPGLYKSSTNANTATFINSPTSNAFFMIVGNHAGISQTIVEYMTGNAKIYHRNKYQNTWGSWFRIYTTVDKPSAADIGAAAASHTHNTVTASANGLATPSLLNTANGALQKSGGTMTGALVAQANTNYTTAQVRNITMSTSAPSGGFNGQIHLQYT